MKSLFTFFFCLCVYGVWAQTTLYTQNFNTSYSDWSLNTTDVGGIGTSSSDNQWIVNNIYAGGTGIITVPATADEPSGITGYPESNYLHIYNPEDIIYGVPNNCNFLAAGTSTYFAGMNTPIVTTGYTGVTFSFWWLCQGDAGAYGKVYYRTVLGGTWTVIPGGPATYFDTSTWKQQVVTNSAFDNQAFLEFGFQFTEDATGNDPAFAVDEIKVAGTLASTVTPVASFTPTPATICLDSCVVFTNTSTVSSGSIDSIRWVAVVLGIPPILLANTNTLTFCATPPYNVPGTYTLRLCVYGNGKADTASGTVTVNANPNPVIKKTGKVLSVTSGTYLSYQWSNSSGKITGATNATYTYSVSGTSYSVTVDSGGCYATSNLILTESVTIVNGEANKYWFTQNGNSTITLHSSDLLEEPLTITIYDATGRLIRNDKWNTGSDTKQINDVPSSPGLYIIRLNNNNTSTVLKWMR